MVARTDYEDVSPFAALLPHGVLLDPEGGVVLLSTPRWGRPGLAVGCAWSLEPRNIEVCDESVCLDIARAHESLLRSLPVGAALQALMTIVPAQTVPAWEQLRQQRAPAACLKLVLEAQHAAIRRGFPHQDGTTQGRLRAVRTLVTLRLPVAEVDPTLPALLAALLALPMHSGRQLAQRLTTHLAATLARLEGLRAGIEDTFQAAGHGVQRLDGTALGRVLARALAPLMEAAPVILPEVLLAEQALGTDAMQVSGGWAFGAGLGQITAQVLSLHRAPPRTYPGMLSAPRAPQGAQPLALWEAWQGPLTLVVNVAVVDQAQERARLRQKRTLAFLQRFNPLGDTSPENVALKEELDTLLRQFFLTGGQLLWGRVHVVLWGQDGTLTRGLEEVIRRGRQLDLEFLPEPTLGSTLFLQTLPLGFDPDWPKETYLRRARRLPGSNLAQLLPLYGGFRGTPTASVLYLNRRGEAVGFDPFDSATNPHMVITGTSGSGKSFTVAHLANQVLPLGASMVILDRLPSYQELCLAWEGQYLAMDFNHPICFNPFYGPLDQSHRAFLVASLAEMASGGVERLSREALGVLADAVGAFATTWDPARGEPHLTPFVEEVLRPGSFSQDDSRARTLGRELARKLSLFYGRGPYAGFVDGPNTLTLDRALTVVELSQLEHAPDLQGCVLFALMHLLTQFFAAPDRLQQAKYFIADETWALLRHAATAGVMEAIARTYRKLRTSAIFLSQRPSDFETPAGAVLKGNAAVKLFLTQDADEMAMVQQVFRLSDTEGALLGQVHKHAGWSSAYLYVTGQAGGLVRLVPDAYTRWLVSQETHERALREQALAEAGGDLRAAVTRLAQRYPQGLTGGAAHA
jgi:conjugal transfer ATP-binding protein TraC